MFGWLWRRRTPDNEIFRYHDDMERRNRRSADPVAVSGVMAAELGDDWLTRVADAGKPVPSVLTGVEADEFRVKRETERQPSSPRSKRPSTSTRTPTTAAPNPPRA